MGKLLSILISTARSSEAYSIDVGNKHLFQDLFDSIQFQDDYHDSIELVIVDELHEKRDLKKELSSLREWSFNYKIIPARKNFWSEQKMFRLNSSYNHAFLHSIGDYLFFASDTVSFPEGFFQKIFYYISLGYYPHALFIYSYDRKLLLHASEAENLKKINSDISIEKSICYNGLDLLQLNCKYEDLIKNDYFRSNRFSCVINSDSRADNLLIQDENISFRIGEKKALRIYPSWYYGNMTMSREDFLNLNGYSQHFDGFKGLNDCEIGPRYFYLKRIEHSTQNDHIIVEDLFAYEALQTNYDIDIVNIRYSFIDCGKLFNYFVDEKIIKANSEPIEDEKLDKIFLEPQDEFNVLCQNYYRNNQPCFNLREMAGK